MGVSQSAVKAKGSSSGTVLTPGFFTRLFVALAVDAFAVWFGLQEVALGAYTLVVALGVIAALVTVVLMLKGTFPLRWMLPGLALMVFFSVYPNLLTIYIAFTNFGDGHLVSKEQAIAQIEKIKYLPEGGAAYHWTAYKDEAGDYALWLIDAEGNGYLAKPGEEIRSVEPGTDGVGELDSNGYPTTIEGYQRLNAIQLATDQTVADIQFGTGDHIVQIRSTSEAAELKPQYLYDPAADTFTDQDTGRVFRPVDGTYMSVDGHSLSPGYQAFIGVQNFKDFLSSPALRGPLVQIFIWNFIFPTVSVVSTFALGLLIAMLYSDPEFKGKRFVRTFLLIPYTIPSLITILIWRGMLNPELGVVNRTITSIFGAAPNWFTDPTLAKLAVLVVNLWLGYPYFMLICSGALQSIPNEIYSAAEVDGANAWQRFRSITLPLLLVSVGPLLIASFVYNFNNFNLIYLFLGGGPPIAGAATRAGHTDILISYVYNLAFSGGRGQNYGLASAVTLIIFILVAAMTLFQFRYTSMWEEVSENV